MSKKQLFLTILFFFSVYSVFCQKESFKEKGITFFIHHHKYFDKELSDSLSGLSSKKSIKLNPVNTNDTSTVVISNLPRFAYYNKKSTKYFRVSKKEYIFLQ